MEAVLDSLTNRSSIYPAEGRKAHEAAQKDAHSNPPTAANGTEITTTSLGMSHDDHLIPVGLTTLVLARL